MENLAVKRVYDEPEKSDGLRILVDRLWPRGLSKEDAKIDFWSKETAPSSELREWFDHDPEKWTEFETRYREELDAKKDAVEALAAKINSQDATLLYAAKDTEHNNAQVLKNYLEEHG